AWATAAAAALLLLVVSGFWLRERRAQQHEAEQEAAQLLQQVSYSEGSVQSALGADRPEGEAYLDTDMLGEAERHLQHAVTQSGDALKIPLISSTSLAGELNGRYQELSSEFEQLQKLSTFYQQADQAWFAIGAEHDDEAGTACEAGVKAVGALDNPKWWES